MSRPRKRMMSDINVVPYIDVMLVLLVIFMITAPLLTQGVDVNLPKAEAQALSHQDTKNLIISVDAKGQYYLNIAPDPDKVIAPQQIVNLVAQELKIDKRNHRPVQVLVKGDEAVDYGKVVQAMVLLQNAGAKNIGLITKPVAKAATH